MYNFCTLYFWLVVFKYNKFSQLDISISILDCTILQLKLYDEQNKNLKFLLSLRNINSYKKAQTNQYPHLHFGFFCNFFINSFIKGLLICWIDQTYLLQITEQLNSFLFLIQSSSLLKFNYNELNVSKWYLNKIIHEEWKNIQISLQLTKLQTINTFNL